MEKLDNIVKFETETGETIEMIVLKEFEHKKNKYAILMDAHGCDCDDDCKCDDKCECDDDCKCEDECDDDCGCGGEGFYLFKREKDKDGKDIYKSIEDEKEIEEVLKEVEKVLE